MKMHSNILSHEFIATLRESAIRSKAAPAVIDQIDRLSSCEDLEADLEKTGDELAQAQNDVADLREELRLLLLAVPAPQPNTDYANAITSAIDTLQRHGEDAAEVEKIRKILQES